MSDEKEPWLTPREWANALLPPFFLFDTLRYFLFKNTTNLLSRQPGVMRRIMLVNTLAFAALFTVLGTPIPLGTALVSAFFIFVLPSPGKWKALKAEPDPKALTDGE